MPVQHVPQLPQPEQLKVCEPLHDTEQVIRVEPPWVGALVQQRDCGQLGQRGAVGLPVLQVSRATDRAGLREMYAAMSLEPRMRIL